MMGGLYHKRERVRMAGDKILFVAGAVPLALPVLRSLWKRDMVPPAQGIQNLAQTHQGKLSSSGHRKGGAKQAAEKSLQAVIPSGARNLALSIFKTMRDSSSPAAPRNDRPEWFFRSPFSPALPSSW